MQHTITDLSQLDLTKQYTYADYLTWWFDERVELIKGYIRKMAPTPSSKHQFVSGNIYMAFSNFLWKKRCVVCSAPFEVRLKTKDADKENTEFQTVVQPDIFVVCDTAKIDAKGCNGNPDLIIEILSISNKKYDIVTKYNLYEEAGVNEYWIVYPHDEVIEVHHLIDGKYSLSGKFTDDDVIDVETLPGLLIHLKDVFYDPLQNQF